MQQKRPINTSKEAYQHRKKLTNYAHTHTGLQDTYVHERTRTFRVCDLGFRYLNPKPTRTHTGVQDTYVHERTRTFRVWGLGYLNPKVP